MLYIEPNVTSVNYSYLACDGDKVKMLQTYTHEGTMAQYEAQIHTKDPIHEMGWDIHFAFLNSDLN